MNEDSNKKALGVPPNKQFESCNMEVNQAFMGQGDSMHNAALLLVPLINDGVRLLVYAGNAGENDIISHCVVNGEVTITYRIVCAISRYDV